MSKDRKKIIIADDSRELCVLLKMRLEEEGYEVDYVHDGFALLDYLRRVQDVDAVILDLVMPQRGGIGIFDTVRSISPASKLIIYTGHSDYRHTVFARKADAFLDKTESAEKIIETLQTLIG